MMKTLPFVVLFSVGLLPCLSVVSAGQESDVKLTDFFKQYLEKVCRQEPSHATHLGDHRFDDRLDDLSAEARKRWVEHSTGRR